MNLVIVEMRRFLQPGLEPRDVGPLHIRILTHAHLEANAKPYPSHLVMRGV